MARIQVAFDAAYLSRVALHQADHPLAGDAALEQIGDAGAVAAALRAAGHLATPLPLDRGAPAALWALRADPPDLVFNLCDTLAGDSRLALLVPATLDALGIPYAGAAADGLALTKRKHDVKAVLAREGLPTPRYQVILGPDDLDDFALGLEPPVIVKLSAEHASVGIDAGAVCWTAAEVAARAKAMHARFGQPLLVEEFVDGREFFVSLVGDPPAPLPMLEHTFDAYPAGFLRIRSFDTKWFNAPGVAGDAPVAAADPRWAAPVPRRAPAAPWGGVLEDIPAIAARAFLVAGGRDWGRVDFRIDRGGVPMIIDVTPNTYLGPSAPCASAGAQAGLGYDALVARIADAALARARVPLEVPR